LTAEPAIVACLRLGSIRSFTGGEIMAKKAVAEHPLSGRAAPAFTLPASGGGKVRLSDYKGKKAVVLFFYSKDMTSG
jgi:cytochrome oxidase Cu insertion factor (SCO1/SenC/PrrC family)